MIITFGTGFSGGGVLELGYIQAGMQPLWGIEMRPDIAEIYRLNIGTDVLVKRIEDCSPWLVPDRPDVLHFSPSCKNFSRSQTKSRQIEAASDLSAADSICQYVQILRPKVLTLENVPKYAGSLSFGRITATLKGLNYRVQYHVVNAADYGVPQTRERLILVAVRADIPAFEWPTPTHHKGAYQRGVDLWGGEFEILPWRGWYEAIADRIDQLPESHFAKWQLERLPNHLVAQVLDNNFKQHSRFRSSSCLSKGVGKTSQYPRRPAAFLVAATSADLAIRRAYEPSTTVVASSEKHSSPIRAFLVSDQHSNNGAGVVVRPATMPSYTIDTRRGSKHRAFLADTNLTLDGFSSTNFNSYAPCSGEETSPKLVSRDWLRQGRVVQFDTSALALLQSIPDYYKFSGQNSLDGEIIGNGVPTTLAKAFGEAIVKCLNK